MTMINPIKMSHLMTPLDFKQICQRLLIKFKNQTSGLPKATLLNRLNQKLNHVEKESIYDKYIIRKGRFRK